VKNLSSAVTGFLLVLLAGALLLLGFYAHDVYEDRQQKVIVSGATPLFPLFDSGVKLCFNTDQNKIATVSAGEEVKVRRIIYEKDCMTVRIRRISGQEGYLVSGRGEWWVQ